MLVIIRVAGLSILYSYYGSNSHPNFSFRRVAYYWAGALASALTTPCPSRVLVAGAYAVSEFWERAL